MSALSWPILGHKRGGSSGQHHLDFKPVDTSKTEDALRAAETACQSAIQQIPLEVVEVSQVLLRYPEGEGDAVTITERDMEELQPGRFLGDNIVDLYIRFLERSLPPEHRKRFYFFNSFFFRKLLQSCAPTSIDPCKVDYEQIRWWIEKVNLFEKDFVFIPILHSSHWSLIIICHLSSPTRALDDVMRFPCVVHLDPIEGRHGSFEGLIRSYVLQAWMERFQPSIDKDQLLSLYQMKYVEAKVLSKQKHIQNLILELIQISQERTRKNTTMKNLVQELLQASQNLHFFLNHEGSSKACIKDVELVGPTISNATHCEISHASNHEHSMDAQHQQSTFQSRGNIEALSGPHIGLRFMECENRSESLSPKQQHVELEMQTDRATNFKGLVSKAKYMSTHEDSIIVQHQQSNKVLRLDYEQLDSLEVQNPKYQRVPKRFLNKLEEIPCLDLSEALKGTTKRAKNMTNEETLELLLCKLEGGRFCKGNGGTTCWNLISEEIEKKFGNRPSPDQCRLRYDTLLKAYKTYNKHCIKTGKTFSAITKEERLDLKVATTLCEKWYTTIGKICDKVKSRKRIKINLGVCNDLYPLSSHDSSTSNPPPISNGRSFEDGVAILGSACGLDEVVLQEKFPTGMFNSLNEDLQSTLLNLVQECSRTCGREELYNGRVFDLEPICRFLTILQDRKPREILNYVFKLWEFKLVSAEDMDFEEVRDHVDIDLWKYETWFLKSWVYEEISKEVLDMNPHLKTLYYSFPIEQSSLQYVKLLSFFSCDRLEYLDLRDFPNLRYLGIQYCPYFNLVTGWKVATSLESITISCCEAYFDFPNLQYLPSLREFAMTEQEYIESLNPQHLSQLNNCTNLRRLEICYDKSLLEIVDLKNLKDLKFLEFLSLEDCDFSNIQGLSGLHALKTLHLEWCKNLRRVPDLGCLKGLTKLDMSGSGVEDVEGVGELHLLTWLDLHDCVSLKCLPFLGHLKVLVYLDLRKTDVKEIPGKEELISLETFHWDIK